VDSAEALQSELYCIKGREQNKLDILIMLIIIGLNS